VQCEWGAGNNHHCDFSLIAIHVSDRLHFSDINISQGSAATCLRGGGMFKHEIVANLMESISEKSLKIG